MLGIAAFNEGSLHHWGDAPDFIASAAAYRRAYSMAVECKSSINEAMCASGILAALLASDAPPDAECSHLIRRTCDSRLWMFLWMQLDVLERARLLPHGEELMARGAAMSRDQVVAFVLDHLPAFV